MRIELHYHTGGHGGPYFGEEAGIEAAIKLLKGCAAERTIDLREGVGGRFVASVSKVNADRYCRAGFLITRQFGKTEFRGE